MVLENLTSKVSTLSINLIAAIVILLLGIVIGRFIGKLIQKVLSEVEINKILKEEAGVKVPLEEIIASIFKYLIYFVTVIFALDQIGLTTTVLNIILGLFLAIIVVFVILAFKDFIPNLVSGLFIHQRRGLKDGDKIQVDGIEGIIEHISIIETRIKTKNGYTIFIPNSMLTKQRLVKKIGRFKFQ